MTDPAAFPPVSPVRPAAEPFWPEPPRRGAFRWAGREELRVAAYLVLALVVAGAVLGVLWQWWSPPGPAGFVLAPHAVQPDETESWVAADGRFAVLCGGTGLVAGLLIWFHRASRGPAVAAGLVVGGSAGSALTELVGHLLGGGKASGPTNTVLTELPLSVHMQGLRFLEPAVAVLAYCLMAAFAKEDDLGRAEPGSVGLDDQPEYGGGYGDAAGALHESYLPPQ
ncbi:MAG: hypothetical protein QOK11_4080 [Pseudonocardiales bacterium]|nr:hypothetical protein [Pseudonocardiales bacterium]